MVIWLVGLSGAGKSTIGRATYELIKSDLPNKFFFLRAATQNKFDENRGRKEGYQLSAVGRLLQALLMKYFPDQFCNIYVLFADRVIQAETSP